MAVGRRPFIGAQRLEVLKDRKLAAQPGKETSFPSLPSGERSKGSLRARYREFYLDKTVFIFTLKIRFPTCPEFRYQFKAFCLSEQKAYARALLQVP